MNANPLISIVTAVYNGEKYFENTIQSIINQSYKNFEFLVVDGASKDNTLNILKRYNHQIAFWKSEPDQGVYDAWNKALINTKGEWICFVGSDDILLPDALESYVKLINNNLDKEIDFISSKIDWVTNDLKLIKRVGSAWEWNIFASHMNVAHVGALHNRSLFNKYGTFNIHYKIAGDYEFLLRPKAELKSLYLDKVTALMRHEDGLSSRGLRVHFETAKAKYNTGKRNIFFVAYEYSLITSMTILKKKLDKIKAYFKKH